MDLAVKKYRTTAPRLAEWLEANVPEGLTAFALPSSHRRRLRTTNMLERTYATKIKVSNWDFAFRQEAALK